MWGWESGKRTNNLWAGWLVICREKQTAELKSLQTTLWLSLSVHSSEKKKKKRLSNAKYEPFAIMKIRLKNLWSKKQFDVLDHVFMLNISTSSNCSYTFAILNILFLVSGNEEMLTACLEGGRALVYSRVVATDNCLHVATLFRYISEIGIFVINGTLSFLNWGYCLENNSLWFYSNYLLQQHKIWPKLFMDWGRSRTTEVRKSSSSYIMYGVF